MRNILYISYDGLTDALGQSQILAYVKRLSKQGNRIVILSYEKAELFKKDGEKIREMVEESGLTWKPLKYTKKPPVLSTVVDIRKGFRACKKLHKRYDFQITHCRGYIAAILGRKMQRKYGAKFIFDMRGWWPDEKLESGFWDKKIYFPVYNYFKRLEYEFFQHCDYAVSLTYKGRDEIVHQMMAPESKIGVVPTCVDFTIFKEPDADFKLQIREQLGINADEKVFVYSGSVGGNYDPDTLIKVFLAFRTEYANSYLLILSKDTLSPELQSQFADAGIKRMSIHNAPFTKVTEYLRAGDVGFIYYKMSFSTIGRSPTKLGEYWASGIPVIALQGIGDVDTIIGYYPGSGILLSDNKEEWGEEIKALEFIPRLELRNYALDYFSIDKGVRFYNGVYQQLSPSIESI
jgi:glycosyltransferase involved in cell wall biosynthesis